MVDAVGLRVIATIVGPVIVIIGLLLFNGFISFSITGNGLADAMIVVLIGLLIFIVGKTIEVKSK